MEKINREKLKEFLSVYFIMGSNNCLQQPEKVLQEAIEGGITLFQFREKGEDSLKNEDKLTLAKNLQEICRNHSIPFIINDDIELAVELDADGVHIGQEDEPAEVVREKIGRNKILGVSAHTMEEAKRAIQSGADYLGVGPIYPTKTKEDAKAVQGLRFIKDIKAVGLDVPLVGIGGITAKNASPIIEAGADGVSIITAISHAQFPGEAASKLKEAVERSSTQ